MNDFIPECLDRHIFKIVSQTAEELGVRAFVIGGFVRDYYLHRPSNDIDIVVEGSGLELAEAVGRKVHARVTTFRNFGTAMLRYKGDEVEFVGARKESYNRLSRKPAVENGTLEDDQRRRDFTINAMAFSLQKNDFGRLVDPFGGLKDLSEGIIRTPLDPDKTYSDDPLRMLRAVRFASKLSTPDHQFEIVLESMESMRRMSRRLSILSKERIADELNKMLLTPVPSKAFWLLDDAGLLKIILPQLCELKGVETVEGRGHKENFSHTLAVLDNVAAVSDKLWLRWAALLHDIGKPQTKRYDPRIGWTFHGHDVLGSKMVPQIFRSLGLPLGAELSYVKKLVWLHLRPIALVDDEVTDSAVRRLLFDAGDDIDDLMLLCNADITSKNPAKVSRVRRNFELVAEKLAQVEAKDKIRNFKNPVSGQYIMDVYGIEPCNTIGKIKEAVKEAILNCEIDNDFAQADALMRKEAAKFGLKPVMDQSGFKSLKVRKSSVKLEDAAQVASLFAKEGIEYNAIDVVDWPEDYPYCPEVNFAIAHSEDRIYLHYKVREASVGAASDEDFGHVWEDSCVEFFSSPDADSFYYNMESNCVGKMHVASGNTRNGREKAPAEIMAGIKRWSSLGDRAFTERIGETSWELALIVPASTYYKHQEQLRGKDGNMNLSGRIFRANFYKCGDKLQTPHFVSWCRIGVPEPDFHRPEFFGTIYFE